MIAPDAGNITSWLADLWPQVVKGYNKNYPPSAGRVFVWIALQFLTFWEIDELESTLRASVYLNTTWEEPRIRITDTSHFGNSSDFMWTLTSAQYNELWTPEISVASSGDFSRLTAPTSQDRKWLKYFIDGSKAMITRDQGLMVTVPCETNYKTFPFDWLVCFFSVFPSSDMMNIEMFLDKENSKVHETTFNFLPSLSYEGLAFANVTVTRNEFVTAPTVRLFFKRYATFYVLQLFIPTMIAAMVASLGFVVNPDSAPARVSLGVTSLLAVIFQYGNVTRSMPKIGYFKAIDLWMLTCVFFIFGSLLEFGFISYMRRDPDRKNDAKVLARVRLLDRVCLIVYVILFSLLVIIFFATLVAKPGPTF